MKKWNIHLWPRNPMGNPLTLHRPPWMPKPFWQQLTLIRWAFSITWLSLVLLSIIMLCKILLIGVGPHHFLIMMVYEGFVLTALVIRSAGPRIIRNRLRRELEESDLLLCLTCGYCLKGLPDRHTCPECGTAFDAPSVQAQWKHWIQHRKLPDV